MIDGLDEGDLVQLKSGGPVMSVQMLTDRRALCMWFDQEGKLQERSFPISTLQKVNARDDLVG